MNTENNRSNDGTVVGLLGGIASGKSTVAQMFKEHGAAIVDADELAHEALEQPDVQEQIKTQFGEEYVSNGSVNRSLLASAVFSDVDNIKKLNALVHPYVLNRIEQRIETFRNEHESSVLVLDVPLLVETDLHSVCDTLLFTDAPLETRIERANENRDWSADELRRREAAQEELSLKRDMADFTIDTSESLKKMRNRVSSLYSRLDT